LIAQAVYSEFVYGGHLLAIGTASIAGTVALMMGKTPAPDLLVMAYLFTYGAYTVNRFSESEQDEVSHPQRTAHLRKRQRYLPEIAAAYFGVGYLLALARNVYFFLALLVPLALSILYSIGSSKMKRVTGSRRLKDQLLVKNLAISFGWSLIPFLVGLYYLETPTLLVLMAPFIFLRLMVNTVFFDVRDVEADELYGTRTIPSVYGQRTTNRVLTGFDLLSLGYIVAAVGLSLLPTYSIGLTVFPFYSLGYRGLSKRVDANTIRDLVADGEYILWMPVVLLGRI